MKDWFYNNIAPLFITFAATEALLLAAYFGGWAHRWLYEVVNTWQAVLCITAVCVIFGFLAAFCWSTDKKQDGD